MAFFDIYSIYQDPFLTNFSVGFSDQTLIGDAIAPMTDVYLPSGKYRVYDRSNWISYPDGRDPGTVANEIRGAKWGQDTYAVHEHSLQAAVTDEEREVYSNALQNAQANIYAQISPEMDATNLATRSLLLGYENYVATTVRNPSNYPSTNKTYLTGTSQWSDYTLVSSPTDAYQTVSDPVNDILTARRQIFRQTRKDPNLLIIPWNVWSFIPNHPRIVRRFTYFNLADPQAFATLAGFNGRVVIAESVINTADNIDATNSISPIWGNDVIMAYVDDANALNSMTFAKTFVWPYPDGNRRTVDRWREESRKSDLVRVSQRYDIKVVAPACGYLIQNATSLVGA